MIASIFFIPPQVEAVIEKMQPAWRQRPHSLSGIQSEADLHCHLPVRNLVILEVAAHLADLKPPHISDRLASSRDRVVHCVFDDGHKKLQVRMKTPNMGDAP